VAPMEGLMGVPKVDRSEVRKVVRMEAQMEGLMGVPKVDRSGVLRVDRMVDRKVDRMAVQREAPREDPREAPRVDRTGECLEGSGRMAEPAGVLPRMQVGVVGVKQRFPLRVRVVLRGVLRGVLPEVRARTVRA